MDTKPQSWEFIENHFITDCGERKTEMIELVRHIRASGLQDRLFGSISLDKLVVSINDPIDYHKESIHITFDSNNQTWAFNYFAIPHQPAEFSRIYAAGNGIEKFDKFIKMINW